ncbi:MAG: transposase [Bacteroidetes bacterium]|nr:transposase [Bacteroidota bacterium]
MTSKIHHLNELEQVLCDNEKTSEGVLAFYTQFKITQLLKPFEYIKTKGHSLSVLIFILCVYRIRGLSIWAMQRVGNKALFSGDDNCFYRLMNNEGMDWRKLLLGFAKQFKALAHANGDQCTSVKCFILDDTDLVKTGKTIEFIGKIFNHVTHTYPLGFKMLTLGLFDGKSLIAADFSLHREKGKLGNYGMSKKERKAQFHKKRIKGSPSNKRVQELDEKKTEVAVSMIKRAVKNGLMASYVLMDSWFTNDYMIKSIRSIKNGAMHLLGMCKMDTRKYRVNGKELNSRQIITRNERKNSKCSRKHKSRYITVVADYKGEKVKLFYIKYHNSKNWTLLLTTDLKLKFVQAIELYQIRWTIEVLFKECKQYLRLGACQNTDFDGQIADATMALITHTILTLQRRFEAYETMGGLFRESQQHLLELTLWERILKVFIKMLRQLLEVLSIDIDETIEKIMQSDRAGIQLLAMLSALNDFGDNVRYKTKFAV